MTTFSLINEEVNKQLEDSTKELQLKLKDLKKVALYEAWKILQLAVANIVRQIETSCKDLAGSDKKNVAMNFISKFYDTTFVVVNVPMIPNILEPIIHRYVKGILMILAGASIDAMVTTFREVGVLLSKQSSIKEE